MNALQFKKLKIGDRILTYNGACTTVTDIDRMAGKLTCGNRQWRDYHVCVWRLKQICWLNIREFRITYHLIQSFFLVPCCLNWASQKYVFFAL